MHAIYKIQALNIIFAIILAQERQRRDAVRETEFSIRLKNNILAEVFLDSDDQYV